MRSRGRYNPHYGVVALARLFKIEHAIKRRHLARIRFVTGAMLHTFVSIGRCSTRWQHYDTPNSGNDRGDPKPSCAFGCHTSRSADTAQSGPRDHTCSEH
jgi:hypothetical protein